MSLLSCVVCKYKQIVSAHQLIINKTIIKQRSRTKLFSYILFMLRLLSSPLIQLSFVYNLFKVQINNKF